MNQPHPLSALSPELLWAHFARLMEIPRGSGSESEAREHVLAVAGQAGHVAAADAAGNVVVRKPASAGREAAPVVALQAHLDMVQEKNAGVDHDFHRDPIRPVVEGDWLKADGTTLGADNGIGVAAMLAILEDDDLVHGPLELLFTVNEETGLTGAKALDPALLTASMLINLDSEEEGVITIGCAGGGDSRLRLPIERQGVDGGHRCRLRVGGLRGGHSGVDIRLERANSIVILTRAIAAGLDGCDVRLVALDGGNARNAIPREATATVWLASGEGAGWETAARRCLERMRGEYTASDPGLVWSLEPEESVIPPCTPEASRRCLDLLLALPHGVQAMSTSLPDLVETSTNLAVVELADSELRVHCSSRSSIESRLQGLRRKIRAVARLAGADVKEADGYPAWQPDVGSELLAVMQAVYEREIGQAPQVGAMHAGLECGIIGRKVPGMDMISFGPQIENPHSPDERVKISSVGPFYAVLCATIAELAL